MLLRFDMALLHFVPLIPTGLKIVKKLLGLALAGGMAIKKIGSALYNIPVRVLRTVVQIQKEIVYFPFRVISILHRVIFKRNICNKYIQTTQCITEQKPFGNGIQASSVSLKPTSIEGSEEQEPCRNCVKVTSVSMKPTSAEGSKAQEPCGNYVQATSVSIKETSVEESSEEGSVEGSNSCEPLDGTSDTVQESTYKWFVPFPFEHIPLFERRAEHYYKHSEMVTEATLKAIDELVKDFDSTDLGRLADVQSSEHEYVPPDSGDSIALNEKSIQVDFNFQNDLKGGKEEGGGTAGIRNVNKTKTSRCKNDEINYKCNSVAKDALSQTVPVIEQAIQAILPGGDKVSDINELGNFNPLKSKSTGNASKHPTSNEEQIRGRKLLNISMEVLSSLVDVISQEIVSLKHRLAWTNNRMAEVIKSSDNMFEEVSKINGRFTMLISLSTKITDLQNELGEDHKMLKEVESDRNEMKHKLQALEKLIKEEEEYLDDVSIESGYDEFDIRVTSPYKHDDP